MPGRTRLGVRGRVAVVVTALVGSTLFGLTPTPAQVLGPCGPPVTSAIACENSKPGNPATEWDIAGTGDSTIQGFATDISVNKGETVRFKVDTLATQYRLDIYRMGYYGGQGARKVATVLPSATLPQSQPACLTNSASGLVDCGNWALSASWLAPSDAVSGIYFAKLVRTDTGGASHVFFVVRDDARNSALLFQTSDTTWQAYNTYGGNSLYTGAPAGRAYKVSYNRPFSTRGCCAQDWVFNAEYPMVRWLEANGYDVSYSTGVDTERRGAELLKHKAFLSVGHDEYWSAGQRANVTAARDAGVNLAFFSGNEAFWKTRWETSIDGSGTPFRTLVSYKETHANAKIDPTSAWTGTWRDPRFSPPADGGRPENALTGNIFTVNDATFAVQVPAAEGKLRLWRNTSVATLGAGEVATMPNGTVGYEWDEDVDNGSRPPGLIRMSSATYDVSFKLQDFGSTYGPGTATHSVTLYRHSSGALVFGAGTIQWSWGLDANHDRGSTPADPRMQQATVNLLADMAAQPATLQAGLIAGVASTDTAGPTSAVTSPAAGSTVGRSSTVTISGTATDTGGGRVGGVEVSIDGGSTWRRAIGRESWTYAWATPATDGPVTLRVRAADDSGNLGATPAGTTVTVGTPPPPPCPCTIWPPSTVPAVPAENDPSAIEVGVKFRADVNGFITGIRFYKGAGNTGTHVGSLWSAAGTKLATVTFAAESASGWQQADFSSPVAVAANTTYVASYFAPVGRYAVNGGYFSSTVSTPPLQALGSGVDGPNGVYRYGASGFPTDSFNASNYWVDVVFAATIGADTTPPTVIQQVPAPGATSVAQSSNVTATFNEAVQPATVTSGFTLRDPANAVVAATVTYDAATRTATLNPNADLAASTAYTATISGVKDTVGNTMASPLTWSFTTSAALACPCSIWSPATVPGIAAEDDPSAIEVGVKFSSDVSGYITGIRFYKGVGNSGTHVGSLWSATGTNLATVTFAGESASGWQQADFSSPVPIAANTTYVASYFAPVGRYALNTGYFATAGVNNAPLRALANGVDGPNGVYRYGASGFPTDSFSASNYWVDVAFASTIGADTSPPAVTQQVPAPGATSVAQSSNVTATFNEAVQPATVTSGFTLRDPANAVVAATVTYDAATRTATLNPNADLAASTAYTATISGVKDTVGNTMASPLTWSFTTSAAIACPCNIWNSATVPGIAAEDDPSAIEVGVKFRTDIAGYITGIRFYKGAGNGGTHVGSLWSATGAKLDTVTFAGESASGWQQADFGSPVAVAANTTYVASYFAPTGRYALNTGYFSTAGVNNAPLRALANGVDGPNGVYRYGASGFPTDTFNASNYWVDVAFASTIGPDTTPPVVTQQAPPAGAVGTPQAANVTATFNEAIQPATVTFTLRDPANALVAAAVTYDAATRTATLNPNTDLATTTTYAATISGVKDTVGNTMASPLTWSFTTGTPPPPPPGEGPGGPILVIGAASNPFGRYFAEILRAEGLNAYAANDITTVTSTVLAGYDVVILGEMPLTAAQVTMFTDWVTSGGNLITSRPDKKLTGLLGLTDAATTLTNGYMLVDTSVAPGAGVVGETMQFHGVADRYTLNGATRVATLYSSAVTATANPAVTLRAVGANGGEAAAFTYDLAKSIVYTRQGNPSWAGQERDGFAPIRSDDQFFGAAVGDVQPDWIDLNKVAIPQADEQQRLLANLILHMNRDRKPLPRFWYLPRGGQAAIVMTGDDHGNGGTAGRFDDNTSASPPGCSVANWECIRSTSYIYASTPLTNAAAAAYSANGFEVALHVTTGCANWTSQTQLDGIFAAQLNEWRAKYSSLPSPVSSRTHCIAWSDWANQASVEQGHGIRTDTNYYYWPASWVGDRPGFFTGSGMPMRFANLDGSLVDVYQAATQLTDESGQAYPRTVETLFNRAFGPEGYYGVFTANMHTDVRNVPDSDVIVAAAKARGVPVVSARQMTEWIDGRQASSFGSVAWSANTLNFTVAVGTGANGLQAMVPVSSRSGGLTGITRAGAPVSYTVKLVKGVDYAFFTAAAGAYQATYGADTTAPSVSARVPAPGATGVASSVNVTATFSESIQAGTVSFTLRDSANNLVPATVAYDGGTRTSTLNPTADLAGNATYTATVSGATDLAGNPMAAPVTWSFTTFAAPTCPCTIWSASTTPGVTAVNDPNPIELGVKFRTDSPGVITGVRFYKGAGNTGTHIANLWTSTGTKLATATFTNETASGWQQVSFATPVAVTANTTYVVSYFAPAGNYPANGGYFATAGVSNPPLSALATGVDGPNGLYSYGASAFPTSSFNATNYWVDVTFSAT